MAAPTFSRASWILLSVVVTAAVVAELKIIPAESGQNITLTCKAPNNNIIVVEWSRPDLEDEYVLLYRDELFVLENQHPSFKDRVDLQDRQMKDGDVSLILKDVTINDTGTYECRVFMRGTNNEPISTIYLRVDPPGPPGGTTEDGGKEDRVSRGHLGLIAVVFFLLAVIVVAAIVICKKQKKKNSLLHSHLTEAAYQQII